MEHPTLTSPVVTAGHGAHRRHQGMYAMADEDPDQVQFYDRDDATACWCACTPWGFGPDRAAVGPAHCGHDGGRACCE